MCDDLGIAPLDPLTDRAMICGSPDMLKDTAARLDHLGFEVSGGIGQPGDYVIGARIRGPRLIIDSNRNDLKRIKNGADVYTKHQRHFCIY